MNGYTKCGICIQKNIIQLEKKKKKKEKRNPATMLGHCAKENKTVINIQILYDPSYVRLLEKSNS